jgi:hypothetical protein
MFAPIDPPVRLHLLLPEGTPDPAAATATRLAHVHARLADEARPDLAVLAWQRRTPAAAPPPPLAVTTAATATRELASESLRLEARVVPRPKPPLWAPMVAEAGGYRAQTLSYSQIPPASSSARQHEH